MTTIHTRQLQQYTRPTNHYTRDNLKLATISHKTTTTIHTANQQQLHKRQLKTSNNAHKTTTTIHTTNQQQLHTRQLKTSNNKHETT